MIAYIILVQTWLKARDSFIYFYMVHVYFAWGFATLIPSSSCPPFTHPLPLPPFIPSRTLLWGGKFLKDAPSAASKPKTPFPASVVHSHIPLPTQGLRPDRQRPPTSGSTKACLFHELASLLPLGVGLSLRWENPSSRSHSTWSQSLRQVFADHPPGGGEPATGT